MASKKPCAIASVHLPKLLFFYSSSSNPPPPKASFCLLFQKCSDLQSLSAGRQAHAQMLTSGFTPTVFVSNCLMHAYIRCADSDSAFKVFDKMPERDEVSWNALIHGYAQSGLMPEALAAFRAMPDGDVISWNSMISGYSQNGDIHASFEFFWQMMEIGVRPDPITLSVVLKMIASLQGRSQTGTQIHALALKIGLDLDVVTGSALVDMYAKCGNLGASLCFFRAMLRRNRVTWSALIGGCAQNNQFIDALNLFVEMQRQFIGIGIRVSQSSYASVFRSCAALGCLEIGRQLHAHALKHSFASDVVVGTATLDMYAKCDSLGDAIRAFGWIQNRSLQAYNAMLVGLARSDRGIECLKLFELMNASCIRADEISLSAVLSACAEAKARWQGVQVHCLAAKTSRGLNTCVMNAILDMYGKCRDSVSARSVFAEMDYRDRDEVSWNAIITALEQNGLYQEAFSHLNGMLDWGFEPDDFTYGSALKACAALQSLDLGAVIHGKVFKSGLESNSFVGSALIDMYGKCGMLEKARAIHERADRRTIVSWNAIISSFSLQNKGDEALEFFCRMLETGLPPDHFTYATILDICADLAMLGLGKQIHSQLLKQELQKDAFVSSSLVDMYAKCGNMPDSLQVFERIPERDLVSWNAVICGYANHGLGSDALRMFEKMKAEGISPNSATFIAVLRACGHAGLAEEGLRHLKDMNGVYKLDPDLEHYSCVVDLLGRSVGVREALDVIDRMPYEADAVIWRALLSSCKVRRDVETAELASKKVLALEPDDSSTCILLSNIYAEAGRWELVSGIRKMMRGGLMKKKDPGCSWIEVNSELHAFRVGDEAHPLSLQIFQILDHLIAEMTMLPWREEIAAGF